VDDPIWLDYEWTSVKGLSKLKIDTHVALWASGWEVFRNVNVFDEFTRFPVEFVLPLDYIATSQLFVLSNIWFDGLIYKRHTSW
jgi:hypothetical protein